MMALSLTEWKKKKDEANGVTNTNAVSSSATSAGATGGTLSLSEYMKKKQVQADSTDVNSWISSADRLLNTQYKDTVSTWRAKDDPAYQAVYDERSRLLGLAQGYRNQYQGNAEALKAIDDVVKSLSSISTKNAQDYYSQWATQDEYDAYQKNNQRRNKYSQLDQASIQKAMAGMDQNSEEYKWLKDYTENGAYLVDNAQGLSQKADYAQKSQYKPTKTGETKYAYGFDGSVFVTDSGYGDLLYDYINKDPDAISVQNTKDIGTYATRYGLDQGFLQRMTPEEVANFNYLYATDTDQKNHTNAYAYLKALTSDLNARNREAEQRMWAEQARQNPVGTSILSVLEGPQRVFSYGAQIADMLDDGKIDQNAGYNRAVYANSAIRSEISDAIKKGWSGDVGSFLYQTGMSMADFLYTTAITGGFGGGDGAVLSKASEALNLGIMGASSAADTVVSAKDRGLSDAQAFTLGTIAGAAEVITEKISVETLLNPDLLRDGSIKYIIKNTLSEGFEEVGSDIINLVADVVIAKDKGEWQESINTYKAQGMSDSEAFGHAVKDQLLTMGLDFLGGALSGGVMAGVGAAGYNFNSRNYGSNFDADALQALVQESLDINPDYRLAQRSQERLNAGEQISGGDIRRMQETNEIAIRENDQNTIRKAVLEQLAERGETNNRAEIARAIAKSISGEELTRSERNAIKNSQYGQQIMDELSPEAIRRGTAGTEWAQRIGTDSINFEEYNRLLQEAETQPITENVTDASTEAQETAPATTNLSQQSDIPAKQPVSNASISIEANNQPASDMEPAPVNLEDVSKQFGRQSGAFIATYNAGQDTGKYFNAYQAAYDYGRSSVPYSTVEGLQGVSYLTDTQRRAAYEAGAAAASTDATEKESSRKSRANGKTGRREGTVKGEGVSIADLDKAFSKGGEEYNTQKGRAYRAISFIAKATGINIVFYNSQFKGAQGSFKHNAPDTIYIDLNSGLMKASDINDPAKYAMLRTFSHEFTHFIEYWNPVQYNELRSVVFDELTKRGENVNDLIEEKMQSAGLEYEKASREVVAEAMTDILPDSKFAQNMAENHKSIFNKLVEKIKEFAEDLRAYFENIGGNRSREANALKEQVGDALKYLDSIVEAFDKAAEGAVSNFQTAYAVDEAQPMRRVQAAPNDFTSPAESGAIGNILNVRKAQNTEQTQEQSTETETTNAPEAQQEKPAATERNEPSNPGTRFPALKMKNGTPSEKTAYRILTEYLRAGKQLTSKDLYAICNEAFEGTQAEGKYNRKDAYDAMELAVNKYLVETMSKYNTGTVENAIEGLKKMQDILDLLPTQNVRTEEQTQFQQFSTPPNIAYLAAWAANISKNDSVLEPSAGIGGLASFAKAWGAEVTVNELSKRRLEVLKAMGFDHVFNENAEHIDNILPDNIQPTVVIMNPPFSSTAGRTTNNKTSNAEKHIDQALSRLSDGGRLVTILGQGMNDAAYYKYWDKLREKYNIRANLSIDGNNYKKYGTTFGIQIVVIDKTGAQGNAETITGKYSDLSLVPEVLEGIRNDRASVEISSPASSRNRNGESLSGGNNQRTDTGYSGSDQRNPGSIAAAQPAENRDGAEGSGTNERLSGNERISEAGIAQNESQNGRGNRGNGRTDTGSSNGNAQSNEPVRSDTELSPARLNEEVSDDGIYATFVAPDVPVKGGKKHPATLVESAAMAAVPMPKATYRPQLPDDVIKNRLSDAQVVTVTYAGQAHEQKLPDGRRKGFFIGDGTGVGKGRQIAGIILDNFMQGRTKAVWISKNNDLFGDAIRDWTATTGRSKDEVLNQSRIKANGKINASSGILYTTYDTIKSEKGGNRLDQIVDWLGKDFDGVIAFDEAHNMGNLFGKKGKFGKAKGSEKARAGVELQKRLPNARIVYVSATAATEVDNLAYAERLGLWGQGTAFSNAQDFIAKIGSSGLAAMELVIRDMKAMGSYVARSISYNGVNYETVEHTLDPMQTEIYDTMSRAWQKTMENVQTALATTGGQYNSLARQKALGNFYSSMQRFYNQVLTSMSMPSVIADMRKELDAGHSCVLQIVNTNEAQQNKALAEAKAEGESLDNLDLTPREALIGYLMNSFPVQSYEDYTDEEGNIRSRPVVDSNGQPVLDKEAVRQRDALVREVEQMSIPDGPLEMLFDAFGTDAVAENTGRSRRVVPKKQPDGTYKRVEERRTLNHRTADVQAFQDGKKQILVFSDAGGTGKSYHADLSEKNTSLRVHYVLQPGWVASNAVQGFGRTHRSNEKQPPIYKLVTTNIKGQKRFTSTIARRLDQLGALTKGQRDTGSGMFGAKDNLETDLARDSLREFYRRLGKNQIEGIDGMKTLDRLGLKQKFTDEFGGFKMNEILARDISTFLNRILALEVEEQNTVFDAFISIYETELENAIQAGTLDTGMENVKADKVEIVDDNVIREDKNTGAATHYIQAKTYTKPRVITTVSEMQKARAGFVGIYRTDNGDVKAVFRIADKTTEWGAITKQYRLISPNLGANSSVWNENTLASRAEAIEKADWQKEWDEEVKKVPEYNEDTLHMLTGALLPIWNSLPQEGSTKVKRLVTKDGSTYLGRIITKDMIDRVLKNFSIARTMEVFTPQQIMDDALAKGTRYQLTNDRAQIFRSRVSGEWRLEISQPHNAWYLERRYPGIIHEKISYRDRYFIPVGENGRAILEKILADNPVSNTTNEDDETQYQQRVSPITNRELLSIAASEVNVEGMTEAEKGALDVFKRRLTALYDLEQKRQEEGRKYKEQRFGANVDRAEAQKTLNRMKVLDDQIKRANNEVLDVENREVLKRVLVKARSVVEQNERARGREILRRYRDRQQNAADIKKYRDRIKADTDTLKKWITHPDNKNALTHVNDSLKNSVISFLNSIDFTSKQQLRGGAATKADKAFVDGLDKLKNAIKENADIQGMYSGYSDLPTDFMEEMQKFVDTARALSEENLGTFVINRMTSEELKTLSRLVRVTQKLIVNMNRFHQNAMFQHDYEAGNNSVEAMRKIVKPAATNKYSNYVLWQQMRPAYGFERFGEGGNAIYDEFRRAQATLAFHAKEIEEFTEKAYTGKEAQAWEKQIKTFKLGGDTVKVPVSYLMGLYELSKRPQAVPHLLGAGLRVATYTNGKEKISDVGHALTADDIKTMTDALTDRQKEVADKLQQYMAKRGGEWGNYVSIARFGEEQFGEEHYYPINSDGRHLQATADEAPSAASLYALLNMSFTKELKENANNRIILYSIFDVFANHMASMAQYNAFALPILDSLKWLNYKQVDVDEKGNKTVLGSVREEMARAYGTETEDRPGSGRRGYAENFVLNIIKAYNGTETQGIPTDTQGVNALHRFNMAQVAYNFRVVVQQPLAITRAGMLVDYKNILRGLRLSPSKIRANIEEMNKYSGIAAWKDLGFYDINISRGLTDIIKHNETFLDKVGNVGMAGAEFADKVTWSAIWSACKEQVNRTHKNDGSKEYFDAVTKLFEDIVYKTQVVDSVLTKSEYMRSKEWYKRAISSFMSEPVTTASMLVDAFNKYSLDKQRGMTSQQAWQRNARNIGRTAYVFAIGSVLLASVTAAIDALRDDDDYENYFEKWKEAFWGNLIDEANPLNKLPIMNDAVEVVKSLLESWGVDTYGNEPRSVLFQWRDSLVKGSEIIRDLVTGNEKNHYTWWGGINKLLQAASGASGLPLAAIFRELSVSWNNSVGQFAPSLKVKTYDPGKKNGLKYAYQDGYLSDDMAIERLIEAKAAKDRDEAYWMVEGWKSGDDNPSNYAKVYEAMKTGKGFEAAMKEMTDHGYKKKKVITQIKSTIGDWYKGTDTKAPSISEREAVTLLVKYGELSEEDAKEKVQGWKSSLDTGYSLTEVGEALIDGDITQSEAEQIWKTYGGYTSEEAHGKAEAALLEDKYPDWETASIKGASTKYQQYGKGVMSESDFIDAMYAMKDYKGTDNDGDGETDTGSVQAQRWEYIDSLPISNAQKDALHLAYYKETTLKKTPWHQ